MLWWVFCCIEISLFPSPRQNYGMSMSMSMSNSVTSENIRDDRNAHFKVCFGRRCCHAVGVTESAYVTFSLFKSARARHFTSSFTGWRLWAFCAFFCFYAARFSESWSKLLMEMTLSFCCQRSAWRDGEHWIYEGMMPARSWSPPWKTSGNPDHKHSHRVNHRGLSLILDNADLNDEGLYEFTCNGKDLEAIKLEVFVPSEVDVTEGEDATLPCRSATAGQSVKSARWRKNGNAVLQLDAKTGGIAYGEDVDTSRVWIPSEWDRQADLSLTIKGVQQQDEGVYYCDIDKPERHRSAVRLRVPPQLPTAADSTPLPTTTPTVSTPTTFK